MSDANYSDETLNAFVDGEMAAEERLRVLDAARSDGRLAARICELRQAKELVQLAFAAPPSPAGHGRRPAGTRRLAMAAAVLMTLTVGGLSGWLAHARFGEAGLSGFELAHATEDPRRLILHVASNDPARIEDALGNAEALLARHEATREPLMIEVVANGDGLALLNADSSPYARRIRSLTERYDNISFMACAMVLERMRLKGSEVRLLPEAAVLEDGALEEILARLREGWAYIRV